VQNRWGCQRKPFLVHGITAAGVAIPAGSTQDACCPAGAHYYCETLDISRPFPSERPAHQPSWPFVWNKALSMPFRSAGLDGPQTVCPALLQVGQGLQQQLQQQSCHPLAHLLCICRYAGSSGAGSLTHGMLNGRPKSKHAGFKVNRWARCQHWSACRKESMRSSHACKHTSRVFTDFVQCSLH
jgi:hypothetical protein